jgi:two-component system chemotaxis sensor kinase CheA
MPPAPKDPYRYFRIEAKELIEGLGAGTLALEKDGGVEAVSKLMRLAHTLKGAARVVKLKDIAEAAHAIEDVLAPLRDGRIAATRTTIDQCLALVDRMQAGLSGLESAPPATSSANSPATASGSSPATPPASATTPPAAPDPAAAPSRPVTLVASPVRAIRIETVETDAVVEGLIGASRGLSELLRDLSALDQSRYLAQAVALAAGQHRRVAAPSSAGGTSVVGGRDLQVAAKDLGDRLHGIHQRLVAGVQRTQRELAEVRERANRMRLVPVASLFGHLERAARDAARELERVVRWEAAGGEVGLDAAVLDHLGDALLHVARNAVTHGIEGADERRKAGKPAAGTIRVAAQRRGNRALLKISDDGRGIDTDAVRLAAARRAPGTPVPADDAGIFRLLLRGGLSTSATVSSLSGRGVGLDVLRVAIEQLGGNVTLASTRGVGTTFTIQVPLTLSAFAALLVDSGGRTMALPLDAIERTLRIDPAQLHHDSGGDTLVVDGLAIPYIALAHLVGLGGNAGGERAAGAGEARTAVVIHADDDVGNRGRIAVGIDRLQGTAEISLSPLPPALDAVAFIAGTALDDDGEPRLVIDPAGAVAMVHSGQVRHAPPAPAAKRMPILVIDDSLTTRTLEQSILESAGYDVDTATSAEQGLERAAARRYGLFVVDVEMPGMDGFTFVATTRADPRQRDVPAILVTSRDAAEDRQRGLAAGASAYIVKAEFDQVHLLGLIRKLLG